MRQKPPLAHPGAIKALHQAAGYRHGAIKRAAEKFGCSQLTVYDRLHSGTLAVDPRGEIVLAATLNPSPAIAGTESINLPPETSDTGLP